MNYANHLTSLFCIIVCIAQFIFPIVSNTCQTTKPYSYESNCYSQCPWDDSVVTYLNLTDQICLEGSLRIILACPSQTFADDANKKCVTTCPEYPIMTYYDHGRRKCVQICSSNPSQYAYQNRSCVEKCPQPYFADQVSQECVKQCPSQQYYQIVDDMRICTTLCNPGLYADPSRICVKAQQCSFDPVKYFADDISGKCVQQCPKDSNTYAQEASRKCVYQCELGTYADLQNLKCVKSIFNFNLACPTSPMYFGSNTTRQCHIQCIEGQFSYDLTQYCLSKCPDKLLGDYSTRKCVETCPISQGTFADFEKNLCVNVCSPGFFADKESRECVKSVNCQDDLVGNPLTLQCIEKDDCPISYFIDLTLKMCVKKCSNGEYADPDIRICGQNCPWNPPIYITFKDDNSRLCAQQCPQSPRTFSHNGTQSCLAQCPQGQFGSTLMNQCVLTCPDKYYANSGTKLCVSTCTTNTSLILYLFQGNTSCVQSCPQTTYADNMTMQCVEECSNDTFKDQANNICVSDCPGSLLRDEHSGTCVAQCPYISKQFADKQNGICVDQCPESGLGYYGEDLNDGNRKCVQTCTGSDTYTDPISRTCVTECVRQKGYFADRQTGFGRCVLKCTNLGYGNPKSGKCVSECPQSPIQTFGENLTFTCTEKCPKQTYGDTELDLCVRALDCSDQTFGDDSTNKCVVKCPYLYGTFGDPNSKKCVQVCPFEYYSDNTTRLCTKTCNITAKLLKDPSSKTCVKICPSSPDLYNDISQSKCVPNCPEHQYRFANYTVRKCVDICPGSPAYYADEQTKTCVKSCANETFRYINQTYRGCLSHCPLLVFSETSSITLYTDNTTWSCVSVCPLGYYAFYHPNNDLVRKCVKDCQIVDGIYFFADSVSRSCVKQCPMKLHQTFGDKISMKCVADCSRKQFRDKSSKQCVNSCQSPYFSDNTTYKCVQDCPNGTYAQITNRTCALQCPRNYFGFQRQCMSECPDGTKFFEDNTTWFCVKNCSTLPDYYTDTNGQKCVQKCTENSFADNETRACVVATSCSADTVADPLTWRCIQQCSKQPMYFRQPSSNKCVSDCTDGLFAFNDTNLCVSQCPYPYFGVNSTASYFCVEICPENQFMLVTQSLRMCVQGCPSGLFAFEPTMQCKDQCPEGYFGNSSDSICLISCDPRFADDTRNLCVDFCPDNTTADSSSHRCKQKCQHGQFQQNNVCSSSCSEGLFADELTRKCLSKCPQIPLKFADPVKKKCVQKCGTDLYGFFQNRTCLEACPKGTFMQKDLNICFNICLQGKYGDPGSQKCVTTCQESTFEYADPTSQQCVSICPQEPQLFGYQNSCQDKCPNDTYAENFTNKCVEICPNISQVYLNKSFADSLTKRCLQQCSSNTYAFTNQTHNVCLYQCPEGFFALDSSQNCVQKCSNQSYAQNNTRKCVSHCPNGEFADETTQTCMDGCYNQQFADNSSNKCVDQCSQQAGFYGQTANYSCVLICQQDLFAHPIKRMCVDMCEDPYFADFSSGLCVLECPAHQLLYANQNNRECVSGCDNQTNLRYADPTSKRCVDKCPYSLNLLYGVNSSNSCQRACPSGTFGDNDARLCLDRCIFQDPKFTWMDRNSNMCVERCEVGYFADNSTMSCQTQCSIGTYADNFTRRCVFSCPLNPESYSALDANQNRVCVYECEQGLFAAQDTRSCEPICPTTPFYYFHSFQKKKCVKECLYPYFGETSSQNCVKMCQEGFYGNVITKNCEKCRTQCVTCSAYLECLTCTTGFYLYEFECVTSCPSYPVLYFSHQQSAKCFKQCPDPYFGLVSTKKCQLSCPISFYPNSTTRLCTTCPNGCLTCNKIGCLTCYSGHTFAQSTKSCSKHCNQTHFYSFNQICYSQCPKGSYLTADQVTCAPCAVQCSICSGSAGNCLQCASKFYYLGSCVDACPKNFFVNVNLTCISCSSDPQKCSLPPLTYSIHTFTDNYKLKSFVVFSRPVSMTLSQFIEEVQIYINGAVVKSSQFTATLFNTTAYLVTFDTRRTSLNENSISIGFHPGFITDLYSNALTINQLQEIFADRTGVNEEILRTADSLYDAAFATSWLLLAILLLFFVKGGYAVLITVQAIQILYMHIFLQLDPIPYLYLRFLAAIRYFHFTFFPEILGAGYTSKTYDQFLEDSSFLFNNSSLLILWLIAFVLFIAATMLSSRKVLKNKTVRKNANKVLKYRMKYHLFHDILWITFLNTVFFAMYQFKCFGFWQGRGVDIANFILAFIILSIYSVLMIGIIKLGHKYQWKTANQVPRSLSFIVPEPVSFPLQIPLRYLRKFVLCFALVLPGFQAQIICLLMNNFVFLCYYLCFMPAASKISNYVIVLIQLCFLILQSLLYAFFKLQMHTLDEQFGFGLTLVIVSFILIIIVFTWMVYRLILLVKSTSIWQKLYMKLTENNDPEFLQEQQRKRDLQFDFSSLEDGRISHDERTQENILSAKSLNNPKFIQRNKNIFEDDNIESEDSQAGSSYKNIDYQNKFGIQSQQVQDQFQEQQAKSKLKSPQSKARLSEKRHSLLKMNEINENNMEFDEVVNLQQAGNYGKTNQKNSKAQRPNWQDVEFDEHQI